jgi:hypothetical protein
MTRTATPDLMGSKVQQPQTINTSPCPERFGQIYSVPCGLKIFILDEWDDAFGHPHTYTNAN